MKPKAVIFDMDGTLVDNIAFHKNAWLQFLKKHGIEMEAEEFHAQNHGKMEEMITRFFGLDLSSERIKELGEEKEQTYRDSYKDHIKEIDGLTEFLENLHQQEIKIGLATMGDKLNIEFIIDTLNIRKYFDCVIGGHEINNGKPDPEIFNTVVSKLGVESKDCIVFEDSIGGVLSAIRANLKVVGLVTTESPEELLKNGCYQTISNFKQFNTDWQL